MGLMQVKFFQCIITEGVLSKLNSSVGKSSGLPQGIERRIGPLRSSKAWRQVKDGRRRFVLHRTGMFGIMACCFSRSLM